MKSQKGRLIILEGIDGTGKSTQAKSLAKKLRQIGYKVILTKEPNNLSLKKLIANNPEPLTDLFLFLADRSLHYQKIKQWLRNGCVVISDRSFPSTWCYQYYPYLREKIKENLMLSLDRLSRDQLEPDFVIILDAPVAILNNRIKFKDKFEKLNFLKIVQRAYRYYAKKFEWKIFETDSSVQSVNKKIVDAVIKIPRDRT